MLFSCAPKEPQKPPEPKYKEFSPPQLMYNDEFIAIRLNCGESDRLYIAMFEERDLGKVLAPMLALLVKAIFPIWVPPEEREKAKREIERLGFIEGNGFKFFIALLDFNLLKGVNALGRYVYINKAELFTDKGSYNPFASSKGILDLKEKSAFNPRTKKKWYNVLSVISAFVSPQEEVKDWITFKIPPTEKAERLILYIQYDKRAKPEKGPIYEYIKLNFKL